MRNLSKRFPKSTTLFSIIGVFQRVKLAIIFVRLVSNHRAARGTGGQGTSIQ